MTASVRATATTAPAIAAATKAANAPATAATKPLRKLLKRLPLQKKPLLRQKKLTSRVN
jgi:hypothetical protein